MSTEDKLQLNAFWEKLSIPVCTLKEMRTVAETIALPNKQVPCIIGEAGIGKTHVIRQIAEDNNWDCVFMYLAHLEREDIGGIPYPTKNGSMAYEFLCEKSIKKIIDNGRATLLCLDEWNRGEKPVMNAAFTLMEDRRFGSYKIPDSVKIITAMNPSEANYMVNEAEKDPAFRRRLVMMAVQMNVTEFMEHARGRGSFHPTVCEYIETSPQSLLDTQSRDAGKVYASPASWEKISDGLKELDRRKIDLSNKMHHRMVSVWGSGIVGLGIMGHFLDWYKEHAIVIDPYDVMFNYKKKIQNKITKLLEQGRTDAITDACESVSLSLISRRKEEEFSENQGRVCSNLGTFLKDLPPGVITAFLTKVGKHAHASGQEGIQYHLDWSERMSAVSDYNDAMDKIGDATDTVTKDAAASQAQP